MKKVLTIGLFMIAFFACEAQRIKIGSQLEKAPTGDEYMVVTNSVSGKQEYVLKSSIIAGGGNGDQITGVTYDGDTLTISTNIGDYQPIINAGSIHTVTDVTIGGTVYPTGTDLQTIVTASETDTITRFEIVQDTIFELEFQSGKILRDTLQVEITGAAGGIQVYQSGNALIKATGAGVTYSLSGNTGTVTVPSGVRLEYIRVNEETANLGGGNDYVLRVIDNNADVNQGTVVDFMPPVCQFIKRDNLNTDPPNTTFPFVYTTDTAPTPQMQITGYTANQIDITYKNVDSFTKWTVISTF